MSGATAAVSTEIPQRASPNQRAWARFKRNRLGPWSLYLTSAASFALPWSSRVKSVTSACGFS